MRRQGLTGGVVSRPDLRGEVDGDGAVARELLRRGVAKIGVTLLEELLCHLGMTVCAGELIDDLAMPIEAEPLHALDDGVDSFLGGTLAVGVFGAWGAGKSYFMSRVEERVAALAAGAVRTGTRLRT